MTSNEGPAYRTNGKRMLHGMIILVAVMAVGAAIAVPNWHNFAKNPPPVSAVGTATSGASTSGAASSPSPPAVPGTTSITILTGANVQGNPNFSPNDAQVPINDKVVWVNKDTVPHTATSGTSASDPASGKIFNTNIITNGKSSTPQELKGVIVGQIVPYYCQIHPYMTGKITVKAASLSSARGPSGGATAGSALTILQGASTQGNPSYSPDTLTVTTGATIQITNKDTVPHTVTNGKDASDPTSGKLFDTSLINAGSTAKLATTKLTAGSYPFHCSVHPYMTGLLKVQ